MPCGALDRSQPVAGLQRVRHLAHHRVVGLHVASGAVEQRPIAGHGAGQADEAGMFARAVVVQGAGRFAACRHLALERFAVGPVRAAFQCPCIHARLGQHPGRGGHMRRLAVVRGAGQRQFLVTQAEALGRAAGHQRQRLQQLDGRARKDRPLDVAQRQHAAAVGIDHRHRAAMCGFDGLAAKSFDQYRIHRSCSCLQRRLYCGGAPHNRPMNPLRGRLRCIGVDFSSRPSRRKPVRWAEGQCHGAVLRLGRLVEHAAFDSLAQALRAPGPWVGAFDFPFGLPRELVEALRWPRQWLPLMRHYRRWSAPRSGCSSRPSATRGRPARSSRTAPATGRPARARR